MVMENKVIYFTVDETVENNDNEAHLHNNYMRWDLIRDIWTDGVFLRQLTNGCSYFTGCKLSFSGDYRYEREKIITKNCMTYALE